jgi:hypothetical protein
MRATWTTGIMAGSEDRTNWTEAGGGLVLVNLRVPAGAVEWEVYETGRILRFACPCGCGVVSAMPVADNGRNGWVWDGNVEEPSLTPSVQMITPCRWHGYLIRGEWIA